MQKLHSARKVSSSQRNRVLLEFTLGFDAGMRLRGNAWLERYLPPEKRRPPVGCRGHDSLAHRASMTKSTVRSHTFYFSPPVVIQTKAGYLYFYTSCTQREFFVSSAFRIGHGSKWTSARQGRPCWKIIINGPVECFVLREAGRCP
jgi:hypothetical protein